MKITKSQLKKIIKEELNKVLNEAREYDWQKDEPIKTLGQIEETEPDRARKIIDAALDALDGDGWEKSMMEREEDRELVDALVKYNQEKFPHRYKSSFQDGGGNYEYYLDSPYEGIYSDSEASKEKAAEEVKHALNSFYKGAELVAIFDPQGNIVRLGDGYDKDTAHKIRQKNQ